jgi:hypothetical protein
MVAPVNRILEACDVLCDEGSKKRRWVLLQVESKQPEEAKQKGMKERITRPAMREN